MLQAPLSSFDPEIFPFCSALVIVAFETPTAFAACPAVYFIAYQDVSLRCMKRSCTCFAPCCSVGASGCIPFDRRRQVKFHSLE